MAARGLRGPSEPRPARPAGARGWLRLCRGGAARHNREQGPLLGQNGDLGRAATELAFL